FRSCCNLGEGKQIVWIAGIIKRGRVEIIEAVVNVIFVKIEHPESGPCEVVFSVYIQSGREYCPCLCKPSAGKQRHAENRKRAGVRTIRLGDRKYQLVGVCQPALLDQNIRQLDLGLS